MYLKVDCIEDLQNVCIVLDEDYNDDAEITRVNVETYTELDKGKYVDIDIRLFIPDKEEVEEVENA